jgi:hypothetical protein
LGAVTKPVRVRTGFLSTDWFSWRTKRRHLVFLRTTVFWPSRPQAVLLVEIFIIRLDTLVKPCDGQTPYVSRNLKKQEFIFHYYQA